MFRFGFLALSAIALAACATNTPLNAPTLSPALSDQDELSKEIDVVSTFAIAKYAGLTKEPELSAEHYIRLLEDVQTDPWIAEQAIFSVLRLGDMSTAIQLARSLPIETLNQTELPRLTLAVAALKEGDDLVTLTHLRSRWQSSFHSMLARSLAAWAALDADPDTAIALQAESGRGEGVYAIISQTMAALMKASLGREAEALEDLNILWVVQARLALGVETQARLLALQGETETALSHLATFRKEVGRHPALLALADEIQSGDVAEFMTLSEQQGAARMLYLAIAPQAMEAYGDVATVYFTLANYLDPEFYAIQSFWANTLDQAGRRPEAIAMLQSIPETSVHHTSAQGQLAWALRREGRDAEALTIARDTLLRTNNRNIRIQLADLLQTLDRDGEAEKTFTEIIAEDEAEGEYDWRIYFARGAARERLGFWPLAESDLKTALTLNPEDATLMNYLGYSWIDRGINLEAGLEMIENALMLEPRSGPITDSLGWAHYRLGNYELAIIYLEHATELSPDIAEILDHLGDAYWQVGRFKEAGFQWQRALKYSDDQTEIETLKDKLERGLTLQSAKTTSTPTRFP